MACSIWPLRRAVPEDAKQSIEAKKAEIVAGTFGVFVGPIRDKTGTLRVKDGVTMTGPEKLSFDRLVEGVVASIPRCSGQQRLVPAGYNQSAGTSLV